MPTKLTNTQRFTRGFIKAFGLNKNTQKKFNQGRKKRKENKQQLINKNTARRNRANTPIHESYKLKF